MKTSLDFMDELVNYYSTNPNNNIKIKKYNGYISIFINKNFQVSILPSSDEKLNANITIINNTTYGKFNCRLILPIDIEDGIITFVGDEAFDIRTYDNGKCLLKIILESTKQFLKNEMEIQLDDVIDIVDRSFLFCNGGVNDEKNDVQ